MSTTTIRISEKTHRTLMQLAREARAPMTDLVDQAVELYRRKRILAEANVAYAALRQEPEAWAELQAERAVLEGTLVDGFDRERSG